MLWKSLLYSINSYFEKNTLLSKRSVNMLLRIFEERRIVHFQFSLQDSLPPLLYLFFPPPKIRTLPFFCAPRAEYTHPRASLILQNRIADGAPEVDQPKRVVPDAPSSLFLLHPGWCTGAGDLQSQLILPRCLCCCSSAAYETPYDSLKNAKCNAVSSEHDAISVRKKTIRYNAKLCSGMPSRKYRY